MIRPARQDDDLSVLLNGATKWRWNRDQILVYERRGQILGMVILWDGGHEQVRADHLMVKAGYAHLGKHFLVALRAHCRKMGIRSVVFATMNRKLAEMAAKRGALVVGPQYRVTVEVKP